MNQLFEANCKDCGQKYFYSESARFIDSARGLSPPERCPECRRTKSAFRKTVGVAYWEAPIEPDNSKRCWGQYGLGRLHRDRAPTKPVAYRGVDINNPPPKFATIAPVAEALVKNLENASGSRVSIFVGPTGTGKSTWMPYRLLRSRLGQEGRICVTQPRLVTLKARKDGDDSTTTPGFIATHLLGAPGVGAGHEIGYLYKGESTQQDRYTKLLFITDGILIRWLTSGEIAQFGVVVIDEAHEQSSNMELIFALLRYKLPLYPRLRVVIASATVDVDKFRNYFGNGNPDSVFIAAPQGQTATTPKAIHDRWPEGPSGYAQHIPDLSLPKSERDVPKSAASVVRAIREIPEFTTLRNQKGDILIFVATIGIAERTIEAINALKLPDLQALPCHAQLTSDELDEFKKSERAAERAFREGRPTQPQRVIVATNYAETSVTISNLRYVIDSGFIMEPVWDPKTCSRLFDSRPHSQAGCTQRKGRVGRIQDGECFRLYSQETFKAFPEKPVPAITREPLDKFLLTSKASGIADFASFKWLGYDQTGQDEIQRAVAVLTNRGALDKEEDITNRGVELDGIKVSTVDQALCMSESDAFACSLEVATFLAFLGLARSPFLRNESGLSAYASWRDGCYDDLEFYLRLFYPWSKEGHRLKVLWPAPSNSHKREQEHARWTKDKGLEYGVMCSIDKARENILKQFEIRTHNKISERDLDLERLHRVRLVLARCMPEWIYVRDPAASDGRLFIPYDKATCPCPDPVGIDRDSACLASQDVEAFVSMERSQIRNTLLARHIVRIDPSWIVHLKTAKPIALAYLLRNAWTEKEAKIAQGCKERVLAPLKRTVEIGSYRENQRLTLKMIRGQSGEGDDDDLWLAQDVQTKASVLIKSTDIHLEPCAVLRADVEAVDHVHRILRVSQEAIRAEYMPGTRVEKAVVRAIRTTTEGDVYELLMELEPGISASFHRRNLPVSRKGSLSGHTVGSVFSVVVSSVDNGREVVLPEVYEALNSLFAPGQILNGIVDGFLESSGSRIAAFIEIAPGRNGFLHKRNLGKHGDARLRALSVGTQVTVRVEQTNKDEIDLQLSFPSLEAGQRIAGYVSGFLAGSFGHSRAGAFIELVPRTGTSSGIDGLLHHKQLSDSRLLSLSEGQQVNVVILTVSHQAGKGRYSLRLA